MPADSINDLLEIAEFLRHST